MKHRNYLLTNAMIPGTLGMFRWELESRSIKDITLYNQFAQQNRIAEMNLSVTGVGMINDQGDEFKILEFESPRSLNVRGISSGKNLRISQVEDLPLGGYVAMRFYLNHSDNSFIKNNREEEHMSKLDYIQFEMEQRLEISTKAPIDLLMRFDFAPYEAKARFDNLGTLLRNAGDTFGFGRKLVQKFR